MKQRKKTLKIESGRSMLEMLGVLVLLVILTLGGVMVFSMVYTNVVSKALTDSVVTQASIRRHDHMRKVIERDGNVLDIEGPYGYPIHVEDGMEGTLENTFWVSVSLSESYFQKKLCDKLLGRSDDLKKVQEDSTDLDANETHWLGFIELYVNDEVVEDCSEDVTGVRYVFAKKGNGLVDDIDVCLPGCPRRLCPQGATCAGATCEERTITCNPGYKKVNAGTCKESCQKCVSREVCPPDEPPYECPEGTKPNEKHTDCPCCNPADSPEECGCTAPLSPNSECGCGCTTDEDCYGNRRCDPITRTCPCEKKTCKTSESWNNKTCRCESPIRKPCKEDSDCPEGWRCPDSEPKECVPECEEDSDCPYGWKCPDSEPKICTPTECEKDEDCEKGMICNPEKKICEPKPCEEDKDCEGNMVCDPKTKTCTCPDGATPISDKPCDCAENQYLAEDGRACLDCTTDATAEAGVNECTCTDAARTWNKVNNTCLQLECAYLPKIDSTPWTAEDVRNVCSEAQITIPSDWRLLLPGWMLNSICLSRHSATAVMLSRLEFNDSCLYEAGERRGSASYPQNLYVPTIAESSWCVCPASAVDGIDVPQSANPDYILTEEIQATCQLFDLWGKVSACSWTFSNGHHSAFGSVGANGRYTLEGYVSTHGFCGNCDSDCDCPKNHKCYAHYCHCDNGWKLLEKACQPCVEGDASCCPAGQVATGRGGCVNCANGDCSCKITGTESHIDIERGGSLPCAGLQRYVCRDRGCNAGCTCQRTTCATGTVDVGGECCDEDKVVVDGSIQECCKGTVFTNNLGSQECCPEGKTVQDGECVDMPCPEDPNHVAAASYDAETDTCCGTNGLAYDGEYYSTLNAEVCGCPNGGTKTGSGAYAYCCKNGSQWSPYCIPDNTNRPGTSEDGYCISGGCGCPPGTTSALKNYSGCCDSSGHYDSAPGLWRFEGQAAEACGACPVEGTYTEANGSSACCNENGKDVNIAAGLFPGGSYYYREEVESALCCPGGYEDSANSSDRICCAVDGGGNRTGKDMQGNNDIACGCPSGSSEVDCGGDAPACCQVNENGDLTGRNLEGEYASCCCEAAYGTMVDGYNVCCLMGSGMETDGTANVCACGCPSVTNFFTPTEDTTHNAPEECEICCSQEVPGHELNWRKAFANSSPGDFTMRYLWNPQSCGCPYGGHFGNDGTTCCSEDNQAWSEECVNTAEGSMDLRGSGCYYDILPSICGCYAGSTESSDGGCCLDGYYNPPDRHTGFGEINPEQCHACPNGFGLTYTVGDHGAEACCDGMGYAALSGDISELTVEQSSICCPSNVYTYGGSCCAQNAKGDLTGYNLSGQFDSECGCPAGSTLTERNGDQACCDDNAIGYDTMGNLNTICGCPDGNTLIENVCCDDARPAYDMSGSLNPVCGCPDGSEKRNGVCCSLAQPGRNVAGVAVMACCPEENKVCASSGNRSDKCVCNVEKPKTACSSYACIACASDEIAVCSSQVYSTQNYSKPCICYNSSTQVGVCSTNGQCTVCNKPLKARCINEGCACYNSSTQNVGCNSWAGGCTVCDKPKTVDARNKKCLDP
ncbi:MAG: hypothetical protein II938_02185 [Alphaproteobacteria bacterium]|nr:hypothetical protein [Alphaproteobacteria bacterium]